ncbi:hypothetical protein [Candidiatus Paracoxiella cheracis]|uniref:hypothetical protein n=1 Tax=Candidiatus Paracoxiella cheracis TaxID=3405120 RepID=UPI003BF51FB9
MSRQPSPQDPQDHENSGGALTLPADQRIIYIPKIKAWEFMPFATLTGGLAVLGQYLMPQVLGYFVDQHVTAPHDPHIKQELLGIVGLFIGGVFGAELSLGLRAMMSMWSLKRSMSSSNFEIETQPLQRPPEIRVRSRFLMQALGIIPKAIANTIMRSLSIMAIDMFRFWELLSEFPKDDPNAYRDCWLIFAALSLLTLIFGLPADSRDMAPFWTTREPVALKEGPEPEESHQSQGYCSQMWGSAKVWFGFR